MSEPELPRGAPAVLRRFVRCEVDEASIDLADTAWLGEIPLMQGAEITASSGSQPNQVDVTIDPASEFTPAFDLDISIVDGELSVTVDGIAGAAFDGPIREWTDALNAKLKDNGKQFRDLEADGSILRMRKQPIPAAEPETTATPPPVVAVPGADAAPATEPEPEPEPEPETSTPKWGCLTGIVAGVTALLVAIGLVATSGGDDDDGEITTATDAPVVTVAPATTSAPVPPTTVAQVGQVDPEDEPVDTETEPEPETEVATNELPPCGEPTDRTSYGALSLPDGSCDAAGGYDPSAICADLGTACSASDVAVFTALGTPGWSHSEQVTDAVTGQQGASTATEWVNSFFWGIEPGEVFVTANCAGEITTGTTSSSTGTTAQVPYPLYSFGACVDREAVLVVDDRRFRFPQADTYTVDSSEPAAAPPAVGYAVEGFTDGTLDGGLFDDANTIHNIIGGDEPVADDCFWFFEPDNVAQVVRVLDACDRPSHFWVFAAGITDVEVELTVTDTVLGTTATYSNPLGQPGVFPGDSSAFATSGPLFDRSVFPCGTGHVAVTACAAGEPPMEAGGLVTVSAVFADDVPISSDGAERAHHVDLGPAGEIRYSIVQDEDGWSVSSSAASTRARAIVYGTSLTLVVPDDELPEGAQTYRWSTVVDGDVVEQPAVPVVGVNTTPAIAAAAPTADEETPTPADDEPAAGEASGEANGPAEVAETPEDFYAALTASLSSGDLDFALDRLDPRVEQVFGDACPASLAAASDPDLVIEVVAVGAVEDWVYEAAGESIEVADTQAVTVRLSGRGQSGQEATAHLSVVDGTYRWFTFC